MNKFSFPFFGSKPSPTPEAAQPPGQPDISALLTAAYGERDAAKLRVTELEATLITAKDTYNQVTSANTNLTTQLQAMTSERDTLQTRVKTLETEAAKTREEIRADVLNKEIATLAAAQGINLNEIPKPNGPPEPQAQNLDEQLQASNDPFERARLRAAALNKPL